MKELENIYMAGRPKVNRQIVHDYGLYQVVLEDKGIFIEVGARWASIFFRININQFWHDIVEWKNSKKSTL